MKGVCANSCHAQDSACATVWAAANANASLANCEAACFVDTHRAAAKAASCVPSYLRHRAKWLTGRARGSFSTYGVHVPAGGLPYCVPWHRRQPAVSAPSVALRRSRLPRACACGKSDSMLTSTSRSPRTVSTGYAYQPPACCTYRRLRAAFVHVPASGVAYVPRTVAPQERCKLLQLPGEDFRTLKLKRQRSRRQERALAPASTTPGPDCTGARYVDNSRLGFGQPALQHAPPASDEAQGGLQPRPASARLGQPRPIGRFVLAGRPHRPCLLHRLHRTSAQPAICHGTESRAAQHVVTAAAQLAPAQHARARRDPAARRRPPRLLPASMRRAARRGRCLWRLGDIGAGVQGALRQGPGVQLDSHRLDSYPHVLTMYSTAYVLSTLLALNRGGRTSPTSTTASSQGRWLVRVRVRVRPNPSLYPTLIRWMGARWPVSQSRAVELNQSINLGVPGTLHP